MIFHLSYIANGLFWCVAIILLLRSTQDKGAIPIALMVVGLAIDAYARLWGTPESLVYLGVSRNPEILTYLGFCITAMGAGAVIIQYIVVKIQACRSTKQV